MYKKKVNKHVINIIEGWNPINHLTPPPACACPKARPRFLSAYVVVFSMFNDLR